MQIKKDSLWVVSSQNRARKARAKCWIITTTLVLLWKCANFGNKTMEKNQISSNRFSSLAKKLFEKFLQQEMWKSDEEIDRFDRDVEKLRCISDSIRYATSDLAYYQCIWLSTIRYLEIKSSQIKDISAFILSISVFRLWKIWPCFIFLGIKIPISVVNFTWSKLINERISCKLQELHHRITVVFPKLRD